MTATAHTKKTLEEQGLAPSRKRGQNFLKSSATARAIVDAAAFSSGDHVVEVGVGLGALTLLIAERVAQVTGIEIDRGLIRYHHQEKILPANVELIHQDILLTDFAWLREKTSAPLKLISNLPYSISNPFIFKLIDNRAMIDQVVVLLQKEMAERLLAGPHTKTYGVPTILLRSCAGVEALMPVGAAAFHPRPAVDSLLVRITFNRDAMAPKQFESLRHTVRAAFASRRKTLANNLLASYPFPPDFPGGRQENKEDVARALAALELKPDVRAENVSIETFSALAERLRLTIEPV